MPSVLSMLRQYLGALGENKWTALLVLLLLAVSFLLQLVPSWRRAARRARKGSGWRSVLVGLASILMSVVVGVVLVMVLKESMERQAAQFAARNRGMTQANHYAVETQWGPPLAQRDLSVSHTIKKPQKVLLYPDGREKVLKEDEAIENLPTGEKAPAVITREVAESVEQNSVARVGADVAVRMNYRPKGTAYYTCYDSVWDLTYQVVNRSDKTTEANFYFPWPADKGALRDFAIKVDGADRKTRSSGGAERWEMEMTPGQEVEVAVHYAARGMDHIQYRPARSRRREAYDIAMTLAPDPERGIQQYVWKEHMSLPIEAMTPTDIAGSPGPGDPMKLTWGLDSVATTYGMGVVLPKAPQPGEHAKRMLAEAPWGLVLTAGVLVATWLLLGRRGVLLSLIVLLLATFLFYTLTAHLSEGHPESFAMCFGVGAAAALALAGLFCYLGWGNSFAAHQTMVLMVAMVVVYPLAVILTDHTDVMLQWLYWALVAYGALLVVGRVRRMRREEPQPLPEEQPA